MNADKRRFKHERLTSSIIGVFYEVYNELGFGFLELKAAGSLEPAHEAQTLNYLRAGVVEVALLLNFGPRPQVRRLVFANGRKSHQCPAVVDLDPEGLRRQRSDQR